MKFGSPKDALRVFLFLVAALLVLLGIFVTFLPVENWMGALLGVGMILGGFALFSGVAKLF